MKIVTTTFSMTASQCGRQAAAELLARWWWAFALPLLAAGIASIWDWRWIVAAMALALVAYPFILMMAYYSKVLTPEAAKLLLPRHIEIDHAGLTIIYAPRDEESPAPSPQHLPANEIIRCEHLGDSICIIHSGGSTSIPIAAIAPHDAEKIMQMFGGDGCGQ